MAANKKLLVIPLPGPRFAPPEDKLQRESNLPFAQIRKLDARFRGHDNNWIDREKYSKALFSP
jgi:hypothetical protein